MTAPLISCIMPTRNRRRFVGQAIWYFLRQDYSCTELIIVDDGDDSIVDLLPDDARIRYVRLDQPTTLGEKRNLACELARGSFIAHWDDDDWIASHRLSAQMQALTTSDASVCGLRDLLYFKPDSGTAWRYRYPADERAWLAGSTLLYRRDVWVAQPFPPITVGEDSAFVWQIAADQLHAMLDDSFYVGLIHGGNTSAKNLADPRWQRRPLDEVAQRIALDREFYVALRNNFVQPAIPVATRPSITVAAPFMIYDGYGSMAEYLVLGLMHAGANVNPAPLDVDRSGLSLELLASLDHSHPQPDAPVLYFCWPRAELNRYRNTPDLFINTMWESSRLPATWPAQLNQARALIVPTRFVADVCRNSGVTVPIEIVPEGVDPTIYSYYERPDRPNVTTLIVGTYIDRKHTQAGIAAWQRAFADDSSAQLVIKSRFSEGCDIADDPRIHIISSTQPTRGIAHYYRQADVLLALGNEGFGLPLVEGMATGLPVIALNSEGQTDVCAAVPELVLGVEPAHMELATDATWGSCGVRGVPDVTAVARRLRWVAEHRHEARELGRAASAWTLRERNVWNKAPAVLDIMEQAVRPARLLRQLNTFWTPSWGKPCGVAEYTSYMVAELPSVRVAVAPLDLRSIRLLHVQHQGSLFNDALLTQFVQRAKNARIPVIVTEHTIERTVHAWERDADVLVALTERGAAALQAQHPGKRVEHVPHGCPTWFPPRKAKRGRVIGAFGFLEPHKGFWHLLDVLRALPDTELLLFSHAKNAQLAAEWDHSARNVRVRRIDTFLPIAEIVRRLAAEADVLVFWYDDQLHASASGAVRMGLATGVPVITSRTSWFSELHDQTYQPIDLLDGVQRVLDDTPLRERLTEAAHNYCHEHSWPRIAAQHRALWRSVDSA